MKDIYAKKDFIKLFKSLINFKFSRILIESGLTLINFLISSKLINNIYIFKTNFKLNKSGFNNSSNELIKKIRLKNKLKIYLDNDTVYKERLN